MSKRVFDRIHKLLAVTSVSAVIVMVSYLVLTEFRFSFWLMLMLFCAVGYGLQAGYGTLTDRRHHSRASYHDDDSYEGTGTYFRPLRAAGPLTLSFAAAVPLFMFLPARTALIALIGMIAGIVLWFYPPSRLMSLRAVSGYLVAVWIAFLAMWQLGLPMTPMLPYLLLFGVTVFIVMNQTHIGKAAADTVTVISTRERFYNLGLTSTAVIVAVASAVILLSLFIFLRFAGEVILMVGLAAYFRSGEENGAASSQFDVTHGIPAGDELRFRGVPFAEQFFIVMFIVFFVTAILILITRGTETTKRIIAGINAWLRELFLFFTGLSLFGGFRGRGDSQEVIAYRDEEVRLRTPGVRDYEKKTAPVFTYRDFTSKLNSLPTMTDQLRFAYVTLMDTYNRRGVGNKPSETPREAGVKIASRTVDCGIGDITNAIETVDYIETELPPSEGERVLRLMCEEVRRQLDK